MNAREDLSSLGDAPGGSLFQRLERIAPRTIDPGEAKDLHRQSGAAMKIEPTGFGEGAAAATLAARRDGRFLIDPSAVAIAIDIRRREVTDPAQAGERDQIRAVTIENRASCLIRRNRDENMRRSG